MDEPYCMSLTGLSLVIEDLALYGLTFSNTVQRSSPLSSTHTLLPNCILSRNGKLEIEAGAVTLALVILNVNPESIDISVISVGKLRDNFTVCTPGTSNTV